MSKPVTKKQYLNFTYFEKIQYLSCVEFLAKYNSELALIASILFGKIMKNKSLYELIGDELSSSDIRNFIKYGIFRYRINSSKIIIDDAMSLILNDKKSVISVKGHIYKYDNDDYVLFYSPDYVSFMEKLFLGKANIKADLFLTEINDMYNIFLELDIKSYRKLKLESFL